MFPLLPNKRNINKHVDALSSLSFFVILYSVYHIAIASRPPHYILMADLSILELYILVCMNRLEDKEQNSYNFNSIMKGIIFSSPFTISPRQKINWWLLNWFSVRIQIYTGCLQNFWQVCNHCLLQGKYEHYQELFILNCIHCPKNSHVLLLQAFEHLLDRELITFADSKGRNVALEYRPVKLLISSRELAQSLELNTTCPVSHCPHDSTTTIFLYFLWYPLFSIWRD
jgi:origin recognition complex subunit 4